MPVLVVSCGIFPWGMWTLQLWHTGFRMHGISCSVLCGVLVLQGRMEPTSPAPVGLLESRPNGRSQLRGYHVQPPHFTDGETQSQSELEWGLRFHLFLVYSLNHRPYKTPFPEGGGDRTKNNWNLNCWWLLSRGLLISNPVFFHSYLLPCQKNI